MSVFAVLSLLVKDILWAEVLLFISDWIIRIVMLVVVPERREPGSARAWLILILLLPWIGLLLYLLLGRTRVGEQRRLRHAAYQEQVQERQPAKLTASPIPRGEPPHSPVSASSSSVLEPSVTESVRTVTDTELVVDSGACWPEAALLPHLDARLWSTAKLAHALSTLPILDGNSAVLLDDYQGAIDRLITDIDRSHSYIYVLYYIFADDATGRRVVQALQRAAVRGVTCYVLLDGLGSRPYLKRILPELHAAGVKAHTFAPPSLAHVFARSQTSRIDLRNHRKIVVIDGLIGYTGSQNIVDPGFKPGIVYEELVVRLSGPIVHQLESVFLGDWFLQTHELLETREPEPDPVGPVVAQALPSGPEYSTEANQRLFISLLYGARDRIVLTSPYFIPDRSLLVALETAALRGVDTHLVVSEAADQFLVCQAQRSFYSELLSMRVQIHLYGPGFLHAKHLSIDDDLVVIGSSNLDRRSFALNSEISVLFYGHDMASRLAAIEDRYFASSRLLTGEEWDARPAHARVLQNSARLMDAVL
jgi:cardiolipin synthase